MKSNSKNRIVIVAVGLFFSLLSIHAQEQYKGLTHDEKCEKLWNYTLLNDSMRQVTIKNIILDNRKSLSDANLLFLRSLLDDYNLYDFATKKPLSPIFRLSEDDVGIYVFPTEVREGQEYFDNTKEFKLIMFYHPKQSRFTENWGKLNYYKDALDEIYASNKPEMYYYTTTEMGTARVEMLGAYNSKCLNYYEYKLDKGYFPLEGSPPLIASPHKISLTFESDPVADEFIKTHISELFTGCPTCNNSLPELKTFAKFKGVKNLFFAYADEFPINNTIDMPARAMVWIDEKESNKVSIIWYQGLNLKNCGCN